MHFFIQGDTDVATSIARLFSESQSCRADLQPMALSPVSPDPKKVITGEQRESGLIGGSVFSP